MSTVAKEETPRARMLRVQIASLQRSLTKLRSDLAKEGAPPKKPKRKAAPWSATGVRWTVDRFSCTSRPALVCFADGFRLVSEMNQHEHWRVKAARVSAQRANVKGALWDWAGSKRPDFLRGPVHVTITRVAPRVLDAGDNLHSSAKAVRDQIAEWLGVNDGDESAATWEVRQRKGAPGQYAVEITIERKGGEGE